jgi:hypothetical protein
MKNDPVPYIVHYVVIGILFGIAILLIFAYIIITL